MPRKRQPRRERRSFGSVRRLKNGRFSARYVGPNSVRYSAGRTFNTKLDAEGWLFHERQLIDNGTWMLPKLRREQAALERERSSTTVGQRCEKWLTTRLHAGDIRESTYRAECTRIARITEVTGEAGRLKDRPLSKLTKADIYEWADAVSSQYDTNKTNVAAAKLLRRALDNAVDRGLIEDNPAPKNLIKRRPARKRENIPDSEMAAVLYALPERYRFLGVLTLFMGLRISEALGVRRRDVVGDESSGYVVQVRGQFRLFEMENKTYWTSELKTESARRDVPVWPEFSSLVAEHMRVFAPRGGDRNVNATPKGTPISDRRFRDVLRRASEVVGVKTNDGYVSPHDGRRWAVTALAEAGLLPPEIGRFMGDKDLTTIMEIYMQVRPDHMEEGLGLVNGRIGVSLRGEGT